MTNLPAQKAGVRITVVNVTAEWMMHIWRRRVLLWYVWGGGGHDSLLPINLGDSHFPRFSTQSFNVK